MAASPLGPRWEATGVWTGEEMLVLGGRAYAPGPGASGPPALIAWGGRTLQSGSQTYSTIQRGWVWLA